MMRLSQQSTLLTLEPSPESCSLHGASVPSGLTDEIEGSHMGTDSAIQVFDL